MRSLLELICIKFLCLNFFGTTNVEWEHCSFPKQNNCLLIIIIINSALQNLYLTINTFSAYFGSCWIGGLSGRTKKIKMEDRNRMDPITAKGSVKPKQEQNGRHYSNLHTAGILTSNRMVAITANSSVDPKQEQNSHHSANAV